MGPSVNRTIPSVLTQYHLLLRLQKLFKRILHADFQENTLDSQNLLRLASIKPLYILYFTRTGLSYGQAASQLGIVSRSLSTALCQSKCRSLGTLKCFEMGCGNEADVSEANEIGRTNFCSINHLQEYRR